MALTSLEIVLVPFFPLSFALLGFIIHLKKRMLILESRIKNQPDSAELTAFLADVKKYGFGFVRVDPGSVFMRTRE